MQSCGRSAGGHEFRISLEIRYDRIYEPYALPSAAIAPNGERLLYTSGCDVWLANIRKARYAASLTPATRPP